VYVSKLPNVLGVKTTAFDRASFSAAAEEEMYRTTNIMRYIIYKSIGSDYMHAVQRCHEVLHIDVHEKV
jgi:hypothetical protein